MTTKIKDTTDKLVYGHEGWLEDYVFHYHAGDSIMTKFNWGHDMTHDGLPRLEIITLKAYAPDGTEEEVTAKETGKDYIDLTAETDQEGMYLFTTAYDNCYAELPGNKWKIGTRKDFPDAVNVGRYVQSATACVFVGHDGTHDVYDVKLPTSVIPVSPDFRAGHELTFEVKTDGKPQASDDVKFIFMAEGGNKVVDMKTDENGIIKVTPEEPGVYGIIARYVVDSDSEDYEKIHYTATHCFRVKEHDHSDHH